MKGKIKLRKIYAKHVVTPFSYRGVAFYEASDGRILELLYSAPIGEMPKSECERFADAWLQITNLDQDRYSPPIVRGRILLESDWRILVENTGRIYHFEKSNRQK